MDFSEKINLLMKMVHTTNFELAETLDVDPSLISRWRTGERKVGTSSPYIAKIARFFAERIQEDFQKVAILELMGRHLEDKGVSKGDMVKFLTRWLLNEPYIDPESLTQLINKIGNTANYYPKLEARPLPTEPKGRETYCETFVGKEGLRAAAIKLLLQATRKENSGKRCFLFSDEPMDWIGEDPEFANTWSYLLMSSIKNGIQIEIIHTLERQQKELILAIEKWLPLYLTGSVKSYYYPARRDDMFYNTSFTLEGVASIRGNAVRGEVDENFTYDYVTEPEQLKKIEASFQLMKNKCDPLIKVYTDKIIDEYSVHDISIFNNHDGDFLTLQSDPLSGMDNSLLKSFLLRGGISPTKAEEIIAYNDNKREDLREGISSKTFQLVMSLPRITDVRKGIVPALIPELLSGRTFFYTPEEYKAHLKNLISEMQKWDNFEVLLIPRKHIVQSVQLFVVKDKSMVVFKHTTPRLIFVSEQYDMVKAMESFITNMVSKIPKRNNNKEFVIESLTNFIAKIG